MRGVEKRPRLRENGTSTVQRVEGIKVGIKDRTVFDDRDQGRGLHTVEMLNEEIFTGPEPGAAIRPDPANAQRRHEL